MRIPLLLTLIVVVMMPTFAAAATPGEFVPLKAEHVPNFVSKPAWRAVQELIRQRHCPQDGIEGYRSRKPSSKVGSWLVIVTVPCRPDIQQTRPDDGDDDYHVYPEFPLTIMILGDQVTEIYFMEAELPFLYEDGGIVSITDSDGNDSPEFFLSGQVQECGGPELDGPEGCESEGYVTVEFRDGKLQPWPEKKGGNSQ